MLAKPSDWEGCSTGCPPSAKPSVQWAQVTAAGRVWMAIRAGVSWRRDPAAFPGGSLPPSPGGLPSGWPPFRRASESPQVPFHREMVLHLVGGCHGNPVRKANAEQEDEVRRQASWSWRTASGEFSGKCASHSQVKAILNINDFLLHGLTTFIFSKNSN